MQLKSFLKDIFNYLKNLTLEFSLTLTVIFNQSNIYRFLVNDCVSFILQITLVFCLLFLVIILAFTGIKVTFMVYFIFIYAYLTMIMYVLLYYWRKLEVYLASLIRFYCNLGILNLFILGICKVLKGLPNPIYVEHLSVFSIYKYTLFLFGIVFSVLVYIILKKYFPDHLSKLDFLTFPYLKEEVRVFLYTWNESVFGSICSSLIDLLYTSAIRMQMYLTMHFILFYFIRILQIGLFCNFVFLHGDLRWNLYLLPLSFLSWVLRFLEYYFNTFLKGTDEYIRACLIVTLKDPLTPLKGEAYFLSGNDLNFELTPFAISEGFKNDYNKDIIVYLGTIWLEMSHIMHFFKAYEKKLAYINKIIFFFRFLSWLAITYMFYFANTDILLTWKFFVSLRSFYSSAPRLAPPPPKEIYKVKSERQAELESKTDGAYKSGHYGVIDSDKVNEKGEVYFEASLTHGLGSSQNPSKPLSNTDVHGKERPQRGTFTKKETYIDADRFLYKKVNSAFLDKPDVKANMDKHPYKPEKDPS